MEIAEQKLRKILQQQQEETKQYIDEKLDKQKEETERYIGALGKDFDDKLDAVLEYVKDIPAIKEKQDMMFEQMGQLMEDNVVIKETLKDHEQRLQKVESR